MAEQIQWYPGHMAKAERQIKKEMSKADVVAVLGDARAVDISLNSDFIKGLGTKKHVVIYNKSSMADSKVTESWKKRFAAENRDVFFSDCVTREGIREIESYFGRIKSSFKFNRPIKVIVAGIPNVGKSMFINTLCAKNSAKTGNTPGVTRGVNWIKGSENYYMLDTPGVLPPKFSTQEEGALLASIGCVKEEILDKTALAVFIIDMVRKYYPENLIRRYKVDLEGKTDEEVLDDICVKRGLLLSGGRLDYARGSKMIMDEFKNGRMGAMSFSRPDGQ